MHGKALAYAHHKVDASKSLGGRMRDRKRGTVRDLRRENRAAVLWSLYLNQSGSRHELSAATGLSAASVTNVIRELIDEGIVVETGLAESDGGRPRTMLGMNPEYGYVIGVDVGETRTRVELFDLTMTERAKVEYPLDRAVGDHRCRQTLGPGQLAAQRRHHQHDGSSDPGRWTCARCTMSVLLGRAYEVKRSFA